ncbi:dipeptidase PepV [Lysinibacillus sp. FSL M8-0216]|uniref:Succinyl-diaminopimelate desuccinylase n=1 Tax=Lysinibacillus fusiformis TaxID=28031 RepID=A0A1H9G5L7_9BACI|nr:dipeptidase PepV [Lysinibacillus fusiformis]MCG7435376.1 dipeptidase PepV [Lysinibacillus fusiformis]SCY18145.1 succinyl-diaminopimelate desuccinylase [Lysinibacillus fusiformis]SEN25616.1 succinyl-diaminopimelate desuccinylase [Lysinibacillus fusiformis]SEQ45078.1 succinyl-diaminopimelate desuccinylase [Lysinibacillus fusiformis]
MNWLQAAKERQDELVQELQELVQINSILDEDTRTTEIPFGNGPLQALEWLLAKGQKEGLLTKNVDNYAGHIEMGAGEELLGILCHVDVVPIGDDADWTYPPFSGTVADGKLYARGAIDDKGPTVAAWMAMKLVKDAGIQLDKRVRMIVGTDEETGFRCVDHYFKQEEMPSIGFAPDADFPLINAEKGIAELVFSQNKVGDATKEQLLLFNAGKRPNMVPDLAKATVQHASAQFEQNFQTFLSKNQLDGSLLMEDSRYIITIKGKAAHAMEPEKGVNAAVYLAAFLQQELTTESSKQFVDFIADVFYQDHYGHQLELQFEDAMSGHTTLNPGIVSYDVSKGGSLVISMRYSVSYPFDEKITEAQRLVVKRGFSLDIQDDSKPHYVSEDDPFIQTLASIYRRQSGDTETPLLSTGGGTYARVLKKGVAFGMLFPGEQDVAHRADEFVVVENLVKAAAIYAEAIVELAGKK